MTHTPTGRPTCPHVSGAEFVCACVCGAAQVRVADPFELRHLNAFIAELQCCAAQVTLAKALTVVGEAVDHIDVLALDADENTNAHTLWRAQPLDMLQSRTDTSESLDTADATASEADSEGEFTAAHSAALPRLRAPLLTGRPSPCFMLYRLGEARSFRPTAGLRHKTGFMRGGTHHLLPWDVPLERSHTSTNMAAGSNRITLAGSAGARRFSARAHVGFEYETVSGRRFMAADATTVVRLASSGRVRGTAQRLVDEAMPLLMVAPAEAGEGDTLAQLVRLHVVVPDAEVNIVVHPCVQFRAAPRLECKAAAAVRLQRNGVYVVQLPRIYVNEGKPILLPTNESKWRRVEYRYERES